MTMVCSQIQNVGLVQAGGDPISFAYNNYRSRIILRRDAREMSSPFRTALRHWRLMKSSERLVSWATRAMALSRLIPFCRWKLTVNACAVARFWARRLRHNVASIVVSSLASFLASVPSQVNSLDRASNVSASARFRMLRKSGEFTARKTLALS